MTNQPPSVQRKLKLDYETLGNLSKGLIFVSISGFGLSGERAELTCYDLIAEGYSGIMDITGDERQSTAENRRASGRHAGWSRRRHGDSRSVVRQPTYGKRTKDRCQPRRKYDTLSEPAALPRTSARVRSPDARAGPIVSSRSTNPLKQLTGRSIWAWARTGSGIGSGKLSATQNTAHVPSFRATPTDEPLASRS